MAKAKKQVSNRKKNGVNSPSTGKKKKKVPFRDYVENPNLDKTYNLKSRTKLYDQDYLHKLSPKELEWLDKFNAETINADLNYKNLKKNLYAKTAKKKKECTDSNNARNRCILTQQEAMGRIRNLDDELNIKVNTIENLEILMDLQTGGFVDTEGKIVNKKFTKSNSKRNREK